MVTIPLPQSSFVPTRAAPTFNTRLNAPPAGPNPGPAIAQAGASIARAGQALLNHQKRRLLFEQEEVLIGLDNELFTQFEQQSRRSSFDPETFNANAREVIEGQLKKVPGLVYREVANQYQRLLTTTLNKSEQEHTRRLRVDGWHNTVARATEQVEAFNQRVFDLVYEGTGHVDFAALRAEKKAIINGINSTAINSSRLGSYRRQINAQLSGMLRQMERTEAGQRWDMARAGAVEAETTFNQALDEHAKQTQAHNIANPLDTAVNFEPLYEEADRIAANFSDPSNPEKEALYRAQLRQKLLATVSGAEAQAVDQATVIRKGIVSYTAGLELDRIQLGVDNGTINSEDRLEAEMASVRDGVKSILPPHLAQEVNTAISGQIVTNARQITDNNRGGPWQQQINEWKLQLDHVGRSMTAPELMQWASDRIKDYAADNNLSPTEETALWELATDRLLPQFRDALKDDQAEETAQAQEQVTELMFMLEQEYEQHKHNPDFDVAEFNEKVVEASVELTRDWPEHLGDKARREWIGPAFNDLRNKQGEDQVVQRQQAAEASITQMLDNAAADIDLNGSARLGPALERAMTAIEGSGLPPEVRADLRQKAKKRLATASLNTQVRDFLTNTDNLDNPEELNILRDKVKNDPNYSILSGDLDQLFNAAHRLNTGYVKNISREHTDKAISDVKFHGAQYNPDFIKRQDITVEDKVRYAKLGEVEEEKETLVEEYLRLSQTGHIFRKGRDDSMIGAWWAHIDGKKKTAESPEFLAKQLPGIMDDIGFLPSEIANDIWTHVENGPVDHAEAVLTALAVTENKDSNAIVNSFTEDQHFAYTIWKNIGQAEVGDGRSTLEYIRALNSDPAARKQYQVRFNEFASELADAGTDFIDREEVLDALDLEDANVESLGLPQAQNDYLSLTQTFYASGMNMNKARKAAKELIRRDWGSNLNGDLMYLPPQVTTPGAALFDPEAGEFNYNWIADDLQAAIDEGGGFGIDEGASLSLFADDQTINQHRNREPTVQYQIRWKDYNGIWRAVAGPNGQPLYYHIDPSEELRQQSMEAVNTTAKEAATSPILEGLSP